MRAIVVGVLVVVGLAGCSSTMAERTGQGVGPEVSLAPSVASEGAMIGTIKLQDRSVQVHASPRGPRFTVLGQAGQVLAQDMSEVEIQAALPSIYEVIKTSAAAMEGGALDASLDADLAPLRLDDQPGVFGPSR